MTTATTQYALMAGRAYLTNRGQINQFPVPDGWTEFFHVPDAGTPSFPATAGFEAVAFKRISSPNDIVISYAGTDGYGGTILSNADKQADADLGAGLWSDQLGQAAAYYLEIKAANPGAITLTGHSLGGGLASLVAVFFGETAKTFDQAPFRNSALTFTTTDPTTGLGTTRSVAQDLLTYLSGKTTNGQPTYTASQLQGLTDFVNAARDATPGEVPNEGNVTDINVQRAVLATLPQSRIGAQADIRSITTCRFPRSVCTRKRCSVPQ